MDYDQTMNKIESSTATGSLISNIYSTQLATSISVMLLNKHLDREAEVVYKYKLQLYSLPPPVMKPFSSFSSSTVESLVHTRSWNVDMICRTASNT
jgi:hypothetical protein